MKYLPALLFKQDYYVGIEAQIMDALNKLIFDPIRKILKGSPLEIQNSVATPLMVALIRGHVYYQNGEFDGLFNAKISKELKDIGAVYNIRKRNWKLSFDKLPAQIISAVAQAESYYTRINRDIINLIDNIDLDDLPLFHYANTLDKMNHEFEKTVASIGVTPKFTSEARRIVDEQWGSNLKLYVKDWASESILKMREEVMQNTASGQRAGNLVKLLQNNYGASKAKAKFLARQETSLLMSKMREQRYAGVGITRYKWSTSHDERVRKMHKDLNGQIFSFAQPPITAPNGARNNPGEDFGCRCQAIPILETA